MYCITEFADSEINCGKTCTGRTIFIYVSYVMLSALTSDGSIERCWTPWDDFGISLYDLLYSIFSNCICSASYSISYAIL